MRTVLAISILMVLFGPAAGILSAQAVDGRTKLFVECDDVQSDVAGGNLCFLVKEAIRRSTRLTTVEEPKDAFGKVRIGTMPACADSALVISTVLTLLPSEVYLYSRLGSFGRAVLTDAVTDIVGGLDQYLERLFREARESQGPRP